MPSRLSETASRMPATSPSDRVARFPDRPTLRGGSATGTSGCRTSRSLWALARLRPALRAAPTTHSATRSRVQRSSITRARWILPARRADRAIRWPRIRRRRPECTLCHLDRRKRFERDSRNCYARADCSRPGPDRRKYRQRDRHPGGNGRQEFSGGRCSRTSARLRMQSLPARLVWPRLPGFPACSTTFW